MNVFPLILEGLCVKHSDLREALVPDRSREAEVFPRPICEPTLHKLDGTLDCHSDTHRDQEMKIIRQYDECVQAKSPCCLIIAKGLDE